MAKSVQIVSVVLIAIALAIPGYSAAAQGKGKAKGHGAGRQDHPASAQDQTVIDIDIRIGGDARDAIRDYYRARPGCPPGLAKKRNGCLPPGQAKKRYQVGGILPRDFWGQRPPRDLYRRLPPPPSGHIYAHVDGDVLLVAEATHRVVDAVVAVNAAMNALQD